jgi:adenylate cyclase
VFRVAAVYAAVGWLLVEVASTTFPYLRLPDWLVTAVIALVLAGFPLALVLAWAFELTPVGVRRTDAKPDPSTPRVPTRGVRMYAGVGVLALLASAGAYAFLRPQEPRAGADVTIRAIAVLPFADLSPAGDQAYFGDGLAEELLDALARIEGLRVPSRTSSFSFRGRNVDMREVGRALAVQAVVQGSVRRVGTRVKVTAQLIDVQTDRHLWSNTYDRELRDLFAVQEEVARSIMDALGVRLAGHRPLIRRPPEDLHAYDLYMRGRAQLLNRTRAATLAAVRDFEAALERTPTYAAAHAGLALASAEMHLRYAASGDTLDWGGRAMRAAHRALDIDPSLGEAHEALAAVFRKTEFDWGRTIEESRLAIALSPSLDLPYQYLAGALYHLGLLEQAERALAAAESLSPLADRVELLRSRGMTALLGGRFPDAVLAFEEAHRRSDAAIADWNLALAYFYVGEAARSESILRELVSSTSVSTAARSRATLASLLAARDETGEALRLAHDVATGSYLDHHVAYSLGATYARLGDAQNAVLWLRRAAETGFPCHPWFASDPLLDPLRDNGDFQTLLEGLREGRERDLERYGSPLTSASPGPQHEPGTAAPPSGNSISTSSMASHRFHAAAGPLREWAEPRSRTSVTPSRTVAPGHGEGSRHSVAWQAAGHRERKRPAPPGR